LDGLPVFFIGKTALLRNKDSTGRNKDKIDADQLPKQPPRTGANAVLLEVSQVPDRQRQARRVDHYLHRGRTTELPDFRNAEPARAWLSR
jgi:hypothetical protein